MTHAPDKTKVISIRRFGTPECKSHSTITQDRLQAGIRLLEEQRRIQEALQQFKMEVYTELAAGAEIEGGELTFDQELKIVRPRGTAPARRLHFSVR
jgi:hypothetical protein